jgi:ectoine hydroxylase-related dioxygenase (phytanoyl-CoA dioxygenase family)
MAAVLTPSQIEHYRTEGFVAGVPVFTPAECARFWETTRRFRAERPEDRDWALDIKCNLLFDWVYANATHSRLLDAVADLLGEDLLLTDSVFRIKEPGSGTRYGWHQDSARIVVEPAPAIVYVAISDATIENGCLAVIPRSHDRVHAFDLVENPGQAHRRVARVREVDPSRAHYMELRAGEVAIFSANVVHGSAPNRSSAARLAILHDYTPTSGRQSVGRGSGQLVRGCDRFGHFGHEPVPSPDFEANVLARRRILTDYPENILMGPLEPGARPDFPDRRLVGT